MIVDDRVPTEGVVVDERDVKGGRCIFENLGLTWEKVVVCKGILKL